MQVPFSIIAAHSPTSMAPPGAGFAGLDWLILVAYMGVVVLIGAMATRRGEQGDERKGGAYCCKGRLSPGSKKRLDVLRQRGRQGTTPCKERRAGAPVIRWSRMPKERGGARSRSAGLGSTDAPKSTGLKAQV